MDSLHSTNFMQSRKGKHLSYEERVTIQLRLQDGYSANAIAKEFHRSPNTIRNEVKRGTVLLYRGSVERYKADVGQESYQAHRSNCGRHYRCLMVEEFIDYVKKHFKKDGWSLDACRGRALRSGDFNALNSVCTKTLYNYVSLGFFGIKSVDLPQRLRRSPKKRMNRENKKKLGRSIEERDPSIQTRQDFGHWEGD